MISLSPVTTSGPSLVLATTASTKNSSVVAETGNIAQPPMSSPPSSSAASNIQADIHGTNAMIASENNPYNWAFVVSLVGEAQAEVGRQYDTARLEAAEQSDSRNALAAGYGGPTFSPIEAIPGETNGQTVSNPTPTTLDSARPSAELVTASDSSQATSGSHSSGYPAGRTVTFSVTYPGGNSMTTTMSLTDFQAALQSKDPAALGSEEVNGQTWNAKDAIEAAMGSDADKAPASAAVTGEDIAFAILRKSTRSGDSFDHGEDAAQSDKIAGSSPVSVAAISIPAMSFTGSSNGMTVMLSILAGSVASMPGVTSLADAYAKAVDVVA